MARQYEIELRHKPPRALTTAERQAHDYYDSWQHPILPPHLATSTVDNYIMATEPSVLTVRERLIFWYMAAGWTHKQVAGQLKISQRTVEIHKSRISDGIPHIGNAASIGVLAYQLLLERRKQVRNDAAQIIKETNDDAQD